MRTSASVPGDPAAHLSEVGEGTPDILTLKRQHAWHLERIALLEAQIDTLEGAREHELRREAFRQARDNADLREQLLRRGLATAERLDEIGLLSHETLDEAAEQGHLEEAVAGALGKLGNVGLGSGALGKWLEKLHPRDRGGRFKEKPGSEALTKRVGSDAYPGATGKGTVKREVKAPAGKKKERVFATQKVKREELAVQQREGLTPGGRPAGMSAKQQSQERPRTSEMGRRLRGNLQSKEEIETATAKDRAERMKSMDKRVSKAIAKGMDREGTPHFNPAEKVSQATLLNYVRSTLTTPSTVDAHSEMRDGKRIYHADRMQLHDAIIDVLLRERNEDGTLSATNPYISSQEIPNVLFMGGGYAAGKSSARKILQARGEVPEDAIIIDPDQVKALLPEFALTATHDPEANLRVYEEAWDVAQELQRRAQEMRMNVIVDGITNTSTDEVINRVQGFKDAGYGDARIAYVDVPTEVALKRSGERATKAAQRALEGDPSAASDMRHIPEPIMRAVHRDVAATIPAVMSDPRRRDLGLAVSVYDGQSNALPIAEVGPEDDAPTVQHDPGWARLRAKADEKIAGVDAKESLTDPWKGDRLPEEPEQFFNIDQNTPKIALDKLRPTKDPESQPQSVDTAEARMRQAAGGGLGKRDPIKVRNNGDGTYTIEDGNATYGVAVRNDWKEMPVEIVNPEVSEPAAKTRGGEEQAAGIISQLMAGLGEVPREPPPQPVSTEEELFAMAPGVQEAFMDVLDRGVGVSADLGAQAHILASEDDFKTAMAAIEANPEQAHVIIAPMKKAERSRQKVESRYGGDWSKLSDVVRGTVAVPSLEALETALEAVKKDATERGWRISAMENRMVAMDGDNHPGPTGAGYTDFNIRLESPEGMQTELQFNTTAMMVAKDGTPKGHKLFEQERAIVDGQAQRGLPLSAEQRARVYELRQQQAALYTQAWAAGVQ